MQDALIRNVFFKAAQQYNCWIGLREPNPLSMQWVGKPGYTPKPESCKAKSADNPRFPFAGLVVDPTKCPDAFMPNTRQLAIETWSHKFLIGGRMLPPGFTVVEIGRERGLVKLNGKAIHADFDLMSIVRSNAQGEFLPTSQAEQAELFAQVGPALNQGFGEPLIQHGAEFMWNGGLGARASEFVLWYGPGNRFNRFPTSMPQPAH